MKRALLVLLLLLCAVSVFSLTGFADSELFDIPEQTLPVELSSFTAVVTAQNFVKLKWVSQSETGLAGYFVYRSEENDLGLASSVSNLIQASNGSSQQDYSFQDSEVTMNTYYYYWLQSIDYDGGIDYHGPIHVLVNQTGDPETPSVVIQTRINSIFPNPFNPYTNISYSLAEPGTAKTTIYNIKGQSVRGYSKIHSSSGNFVLAFDGQDDHGNSLSSGVYYVVMQVGKQKFMRKMALLK